MKKKGIKTEYIIIGIIVVLLAYLILRKGDKMHYELPEFESLDRGELTKVEIIKPGQTIQLIRKDKKWIIDPQGFSTDENRMNKIVDAIVNLTLSELVSKSENYAIYGLDNNNRIRVKAYKSSQLLREFEIGKSASTYRHTYVKLSKDKNVYHAETNFRNDFDKKIDDLRDKVVLRFDINEISEMSVIRDKKKVHFVKKVQSPASKPEDKDKKQKEKTPLPPKEVVSWVTGNGEAGDKAKLDSILSTLSNLSCDEYINNQKKGDLKNPICQFVLKGNKEYRISVFKKSDKDGKKYPAVSSGNPYPFLLSSNKTENIMKDPSDLIKKK